MQGIDPRIKLRHLSCFWEVARHKSVVAGADALHISQPAASKTIKELEDILGGALFDRSHRNLILSPLGDTFFRYAATALAALRQGITAVRGADEDPILRVGALPTVSAGILPKAVLSLLQDYPNHRCRIITGPNDYLLHQLRTAEVDLVIGRMVQPEQMLGLGFEHLYFERVVMAVRPHHPLLAQAPFALRDIQAYQVLMPTPDAVIRTRVDQLLLAHGVSELRNGVETVSNTFGRSFVRQSNAIWLISEGVVAQDVAEGQLALLPVDMGETLGPVGFTTRSALAPSLSASLFMQAVRKVAAGLN